ncbi:MAG: AAA family ATPase [Tepidisphaeraceae bacterium]
MRRVVVVGSSGSGKSTLARALVQRLGVPHVELDALHWGPNWTPTPMEILRPRVEAALAGEGWTVCGNYLTLRQTVWSRADTIIWLDYPMSLVVWWVLRRTVRRCFTREPLWSNNVESWRLSFFDRESIILWTLRTWRKNRRAYPELFRSPDYRHLRKYRFVSPMQTRRWLDSVPEIGSDSCPASSTTKSSWTA